MPWSESASRCASCSRQAASWAYSCLHEGRCGGRQERRRHRGASQGSARNQCCRGGGGRGGRERPRGDAATAPLVQRLASCFTNTVELSIKECSWIHRNRLGNHCLYILAASADRSGVNSLSVLQASPVPICIECVSSVCPVCVLVGCVGAAHCH